MDKLALRRSAVLCCALALALATTVASNDADACGGCFHPEEADPTVRSTVVTAHRMALAISPTQTVLWDQVRYDGAPAEFAWVLPVKPGARIEVATDAWFDTLDAATTTQVASPPLNCQSGGPSGGFGDDGDGYYGSDGAYYEDGGGSSGCNCMCGSSDEAGDGSAGPSGAAGVGGSGNAGVASAGPSGAGGGAYVPPPPVSVVHEGTVGPYETVTLHANEEGALPTWLTEHGYAIDSDIQPIIDAYADEGFDFIALRLAPDQGVQQMKPVRVVSPGAVPTLPLRMVAAGTGANVAITLFVLGEGRWKPANFPSQTLDPSLLSWDFVDSSSNYAVLRAGILDEDGGRTWLSSYARRGPLLSQLSVDSGLGSIPVEYAIDDGTIARTIAEAYFSQGFATGEAVGDKAPFDCLSGALAHEESLDLVVDACAQAGGAGGVGGAGVGGAGVGGASSGGAGGAPGGSGGQGGAGDSCVELGPGEIDAHDFTCGNLDDLAVAFTGMHPRDVWVTRLESDLPRAALATDLDIDPAVPQDEVTHFHTPTKATGNPCPLAITALRAPRRGPPTRGGSRQPAMLLGIACLVALATLRRSQRYARGPALATT